MAAAMGLVSPDTPRRLVPLVTVVGFIDAAFIVFVGGDVSAVLTALFVLAAFLLALWFVLRAMWFRRLIFRPRLPPPQVIEAHVGHDAIKPGIKTAFESEAVQVAIDLEECFLVNVARVLGLSDRKGAIAPGMDADLALVGEDGRVVWTMAAGRVVFDARTITRDTTVH